MLDKAYSPASVEKKWADAWGEARLFRAEPAGDPKNAFSIVIPPPNVTGALHIGHALNNTLQDVLIRWRRLQGRPACWVPGTDHGGIATQNVMEKQLKGEGRTRHELGREEFLKRMRAWTESCQGTILGQLRRLGCALDWDRTAFTMDEPRAKAVVAAFTRLWEQGLIYRGERMVNWCVRCGTALSDIEVEYEERKTSLWHIRYPVEGDAGRAVTVATTRPETLLGDTAVAVNPEDRRYRDLVGRSLRLPLADRAIPVVADAHVDASFGTGAVKVTPAHDPNDFEIWQRHKDAVGGPLKVIDLRGRMGPAAGAGYAGLTREEARKRVVEDLKARELLEKEEPYKHSVGVCYRCQQVIEPLLSEQWFMRMQPLAQGAALALEKEAFRIFPDSWEGPYRSWLENIRDWCLSRQIWWGHRIPVWYCVGCLGDRLLAFWSDEVAPVRRLRERGIPLADIESMSHHLTVQGVRAETGQGRGLAVQAQRPKSCPDCGGGEWLQDPDVLDTWFSSALWPLSVFGWPQETADLRFFYPTSVLVTGYEILYLWVARMQMMGARFDRQGRAPFAHAVIHGIVRDKSGKKMSKSLGNVIDPLVMMDAHGTDAFRFSLVRQAYPGKDIPYSEDSITGPRNFANKLWNSSRFVLMNLPEGARPAAGSGRRELADRWILAEFARVRAAFDGHMERYELAQAAEAVYGFLWDKFCDWYIELAKPRISSPEVQSILVRVLIDTVKLLHPFMPYITEEIYQALKPYAGETARFVLEAGLPQPPDPGGDAAPMESVVEAVSALRALRSQLNVPPGMKMKALYAGGKVADPAYVVHLARLESLEPASGPRPAQSATAVAGQTTFYVPLAGLIDLDKERKRLAKDVERLAAELARCDAMLENASFVERAPADEVGKVRQRRAEVRRQHDSLQDTLRSLL